MKITYFLGLLTLLLLQQSCTEKEEPTLYSGYVQVQESSFGLTSAFYQKDVIGAEVSTYRTETDFWLERNSVHKGLTDERGYFYLYKDAPKPDENTYWVKVKYGKLNNYRYVLRDRNDTTKPTQFLWPRYRGEKLYQYNTAIAPTPTKLQLKVFQNGSPVKGAQVDLYFSKEDYLNFHYLDKITNLYYETDDICTNDFKDVVIRDKYNKKVMQKSYRGKTNSEGIASICCLEPRKYWMRIRKDGKNNDNTLFETDTLPDDVNVQNYYEIGIQ